MTIAIPDRVLILDRDGVINEDSDAYIKSLDEWKPLPGSIEAIARLSHAGYRHRRRHQSIRGSLGGFYLFVT